MMARRLHTVASHLTTPSVASEKSVESPVLAKLGAVERYKYVTGKEPLIQVRRTAASPPHAACPPNATAHPRCSRCARCFTSRLAVPIK